MTDAPRRLPPDILASAVDQVFARPRPPSPAQIAWEQAQCKADPIYFINHWCQIQDNVTKTWIAFKLWPAQAQALKVVMAHKFTQAMKARQLGFTWLLGTAYPLWQMVFDPIAEILIFSQRDDEAQKLLERLKGMYERLPDWMRIDVKTDSAHEFRLVNGSGAQALPASAGGRSNAATYVVIDEADFVDGLDNLIAAAKPTVDAGDNKLVLISTVNPATPNSTFQRLFKAAEAGQGSWQGVFIPWYERPGRTQEWYEREKADSFAAYGTLDHFIKEYPATAAEALALRELNKRFPPQWVQMVTSPARPLPIPADAPAFAGLQLYAYPIPGKRYGVGADPSGGKTDGDPAVCQVVDADTMQQVAKFAGQVEPSAFADIVADVATYYHNAPINFELNNHGHETRVQLRKRGVTLRMGMTKHGPANNPGWLTTEWSKALMYDIAVKVVQQTIEEARQSGGPVMPLIVDSVTSVELSSIELAKSEGGNGLNAPEGCFPAGTLIQTSDGCVLPIDRVQYGYSVITHTGEAHNVERIFERSCKGKLIQITAAGLPSLIEATPEHPFWAKVRTCKRLPRRAVRKDVPSEWIAAEKLKVGDWLAVPKRIGLPATSFSEDQLYALGFWLAEGHLIKGWSNDFRGIGLTNTEQSYITKAATALESLFPNDRVKRGNDRGVWFENRPAKSSFKLKRRDNAKPIFEWVLRSREAADFFAGFGENCATKHIPSDLFNTSGLLPLVSGFIDGDGSQRKNQQRDVNIYSTSENLAWQLRQILIDNGIWCTLNSQVRKPFVSTRDGRTIANPKTVWVINIKASFLHLLPKCKVEVPDQRHLRHVMEDDEYFYTPIKSITERDYEGPVYNFAVDGDNSYTAGGVAVHNCHDDHAVALALAWVCVYRGVPSMSQQRYTGLWGGTQAERRATGGPQRIVPPAPARAPVAVDRYTEMVRRSRFRR